MKILEKPKYLYMSTEDKVSYHLGENGKIYVYEATQEVDYKRVTCSSIVAVTIIVLLRGIEKSFSAEFLSNNSLLVVLVSTLVGLIAGIVCLLLIKDDSVKTFSEDKTIEMDEEIIREHLRKGFKRRFNSKLFMYGWVLLSFVVSILMIFGYMLSMVWINPVMWAASVILLFVSKFYASPKKAENIIKKFK